MISTKIGALICFIFAALFIGIGILIGEIKVGVALFFPFLIGSGMYAFVGFLCLFVAILLLVVDMSNRFSTYQQVDLDDEKEKTKDTQVIHGGGVVFIGPFPIVFGSNKKVTVLLIIIAVIGLLVIYFGLRDLI